METENRLWKRDFFFVPLVVLLEDEGGGVLGSFFDGDNLEGSFVAAMVSI